MPSGDEIVNTIRNHLDNLLMRPNLIHAPRDSAFTKPVKTALCEACVAIFPGPLHICATGVQIPPANQGEWLYDVTCFRYEAPWPNRQKILLVGEVEWGDNNPRAAVLQDFAKLLVARAEVRVMVYNLDHMPFDELASYIDNCGDSQSGDTYLLAAFANGGIAYCRVDVDSQRNVQVTPL